jgi:hypothetical protein
MSCASGPDVSCRRHKPGKGGIAMLATDRSRGLGRITGWRFGKVGVLLAGTFTGVLAAVTAPAASAAGPKRESPVGRRGLTFDGDHE